VHNEPSAEQCGRFPEGGIHQTLNDRGKANIKQVNPALRLPAGRYAQAKKEINKNTLN
jgi:hypothetical protein